jgi:hypothetical protein
LIFDLVKLCKKRLHVPCSGTCFHSDFLAKTASCRVTSVCKNRLAPHQTLAINYLGNLNFIEQNNSKTSQSLPNNQETPPVNPPSSPIRNPEIRIQGKLCSSPIQNCQLSKLLPQTKYSLG